VFSVGLFTKEVRMVLLVVRGRIGLKQKYMFAQNVVWATKIKIGEMSANVGAKRPKAVI